MTARLLAAAALAVLAAGCTSTPAGTPPPPASTPPPSSTGFQAGDNDQPPPPPPRQVSDPGHVTGTLTGPCYARGTPPAQLPDPRCTPGAYDPLVTAAILCDPQYTTRAYRPPASQTTRFKYSQAYPAYGIPPSTPAELDHLINLDLGGSNAAENLWVEAGPVPNPKDKTEARLHRWVCAARGTEAEARLRSAQNAIAADWLIAEQVLGIK